MELLIVTGISGAGKSLAVHALEDIGYFCIDNIPAGLLADFAALTLAKQMELGKVAMVLDSRGCRSAEGLEEALEQLSQKKMAFRVLFLDASDDVLVRRYQETRRRHPLSHVFDCSTQQAVQQERQIMSPLFEKADYIVDTSLLSTAQLRERLVGLFLSHHNQGMALNIMSFGFKFGQPKEADIVLDVRCLPNPFYIPELKDKTGMDEPVVEYVMGFEESQQLLKHILSLLEFSLPLYVREGKSQLTIAVGCTGGKHRSITFARKIGAFCRQQGYEPTIQHRDIHRKN